MNATERGWVPEAIKGGASKSSFVQTLMNLTKLLKKEIALESGGGKLTPLVNRSFKHTRGGIDLMGYRFKRGLATADGTFVVVASVSLLLMGNVASADVSAESQNVLDVEITLGERFGHLHGNANLGTLNAGERYQVSLEIHNPTPRSFMIGDVSASCSCIDIKQSEKRVPANGSMTVSFSAKVPESSKFPSGSWRLNLRPVKAVATGLHIGLDYNLAGLINFKSMQAVFRVEDDTSMSQFLVPIVITDPVKPGEVEVTLPKSFAKGRATVIQRDGSSFLQLTLDNREVPGSGVSGEIICKDPSSGREGKIYCVVEGAQQLRVYPAFLRLRPVSDGAAKATAVLHYPDLPTDTTPLVSGLLFDKSLAVKTTVLAKGIVRAELRMTAEQGDELRDREAEERQVAWIVKTGKRTLRTSSVIIP